MKTCKFYTLVVIALVLAPRPSTALTYYVADGNPDALAPYTNWSTAAATIQPAIDAADIGDEIVVGDGVYDTGGMTFFSALTNRVVIYYPLTVRSLNGPEVTVIRGNSPMGSAAVRCVYLANGATLEGFTLTNGSTLANSGGSFGGAGGGVYCFGENAVVRNCILRGNSARNGGGGASGGILIDCIVAENSTLGIGGGASYSTLENCVITGNIAGGGGGVFECVLRACTVRRNIARGTGGGAISSIMTSCLISENAALSAGGSATGHLVNCTIVYNKASYAGGVQAAVMDNCILYHNSASQFPNWSGGYFSYCCTTPLPTGPGNIEADPRLVSLSSISSNSPCVGAGNINTNVETDINGELWNIPRSIGCDEVNSGAVTGDLQVAVRVDFNHVVTGIVVRLAAEIEGRVTTSDWDFGDSIITNNQPITHHAWSAPGEYTVMLTAYNESHPEGVSTSTIVLVEGSASTHYVAISNATPAAPFTDWETAATNIQDAIAVAIPGALILVSNGVYNTGGVIGHPIGGLSSNRIAIYKPLTVRSVNGPSVTTIRGQGPIGFTAVRCAYLADGAMLSGFTLINGATWDYFGANDGCGGGVSCAGQDASIVGCIIGGNSASWQGGGAFNGVLNHCLVAGNTAFEGGGTYDSILTGCTLNYNSVNYAGGGTANGTLTNCIVYFNQAPSGANISGGSAGFTCSVPLPPGPGNLTNNPMFASIASGDSHLTTNSPCINRGNNAVVASPTDLDSNPRIVAGIVDMGAYELQQVPPFLDTDGDVMPDWWEARYGFNPANSNAPAGNADSDPASDLAEYIADSDPTNATSFFSINDLSSSPTVGVQFDASTARVYTLEYKADLAENSWGVLQSNAWGTGAGQWLVDTNAGDASLYRIGVRLP